MYVFDRDVHLYFWNIECTQRKLAVDEALRANVVINIVYIKKRLQSNLRQYNEPLYNEVLDMIERTIFFIPVIINLNIKKNFDITKPRYSWRANFAPPPPPPSGSSSYRGSPELSGGKWGAAKATAIIDVRYDRLNAWTTFERLYSHVQIRSSVHKWEFFISCVR